MKLKLHNFRCHSDSEYEFPDLGLVLLSGNSGSGKSTILKAILYALFGSKAVRKPYSFGTNTCSVTLEFMGMKIHRTNRPNRVTVNGDLEDAAAQSFIDEKIGVGYDEFLVSSYIPQKNNSSVLSLSQTDQLRMIKTLAFENNQNELHKEKLKEMIHDSLGNLTEKRAEVQLSQREVDRINESLTTIDFPLTIEKGQTETITIKNYRKRMRTFSKRVGTLLETKANLNEDLQKHTHAKSELELVHEKLARINKQQQKAETRRQELISFLKNVPEDLQSQVDNTELSIQYLELRTELNKLQTQFNQIKDSETQERNVQKTTIEKDLWQNQNCETATSELEHYQEQASLWKQYQNASKEFQALQSELGMELTKDRMIEHYDALIIKIGEQKTQLYKQREQLAVAAERLALEKEIVYCPECETPLRWQDNTLVSTTKTEPIEERNYSTEIKKVEQQLRTLTKEKTGYEKTLQRIRQVNIPENPELDYNKVRDLLQTLTKYIAKNKRYEEELTRIERESDEGYLTPALKGLYRQINNKESELEELADYASTNDLKHLYDQLQLLNSQLDNYQTHTEEMVCISSELKDLEKKCKQLTLQIEKLEKVTDIDVDAIKRKITNVDGEITKVKDIQEQDEELSDAVDQYLESCEQQKELDRWEEQLTIVTKQLKRAERVHTAHLTLKDKYIQAEIIALESTIESINEHTRYYLDTFFSEHELSAKLEAVHKGKKIQTLKINTSINYKGNEYDDINQLSGGEFDRCTLASICGINSMLGSPILILDESLASLDTDTNTEIIRFLSELAEDKLILVCSHEAVRGIFDTVLEL